MNEPVLVHHLNCGYAVCVQWNLSTRDELGTGPLSLIQWSLSTRDKLGTGPLSLGERLSSDIAMGRLKWKFQRFVLSLIRGSTLLEVLLYTSSCNNTT